MFEKGIDPALVNKIKDLAKSPEGEKIKRMFQGVSKEELLNKIKKANINETDFLNFLENADNEDLKNRLGKIDLSDFKRW